MRHPTPDFFSNFEIEKRKTKEMNLEGSLFISLLILTLYFIYKRFQQFQLFAKLGIPGPCPNILTGNLLELNGKGKLVTEVMTVWERKYGQFYGYFRGVRPTLVVRDEEVIKEILVRNSASFINRPTMIIDIPPLPHTVVGLKDQRWREVRQILSPTFSSAKIKQMLPIMWSCVETTLTILQERGGNEVVDAYGLFQGLSCDVISACALAMKVNSQRDPNDKFFTACKGFLENAMGPIVKAVLCFPPLAKVMEVALVTFDYSHEMTKMIIGSVKTAMAVRREMNLEQGRGDHPPVDILQLMMDTTTLSTSNIPPLSDEEIVGNAWVLILGGFETTSSSLSYTCHLLSIHEDIQERLFVEMKESFGLNEVPSYEKIVDLNYLDQVICESLRLYPPVVNFIVRGLAKDSWIGPYFVPKHVGIQIPVWQIHHDPKIWEEPYKFDPNRFRNNAKKTYSNNIQWIPFGNGPRSCIGSRFALLNLKFTLCSILRKFKIIPASETTTYQLKLKVPSVTIVPGGGVPLRFIQRNE